MSEEFQDAYKSPFKFRVGVDLSVGESFSMVTVFRDTQIVAAVRSDCTEQQLLAFQRMAHDAFTAEESAAVIALLKKIPMGGPSDA